MYLRELKKEDAHLMLEWMHDKSIVGQLKGDFCSKTIEDCNSFISSSISKTIHQTNSVIGVELIPLVLYRVDSGISNKNHSETYMDDLSRINKRIHVYKAHPIGRLIFNQMTEKTLLLVCTVFGMLRGKSRKRILAFNKTIKDNIADALEYIKRIIELSASFLNSVKEEID